MALTRITRGVIKPNENYDTHNINSTGIVTAIGLNVSGNASIGGVLTYEDVTNVDSVGIITARVGVDCDGDLDVDGHTNLDNVSVAGVSTFSGNVSFASSISTPTGVNINVGSNDEIQLRYNGNIGTLDMYDYNAFCMAIRSAYTLILRANFGTNTAALGDGYGLDLTDISVSPATPDYDLGRSSSPFGTLFSKQANFSGIVTATNDIKLTDTQGKLEATGANGLTLNASNASGYVNMRTAGAERLRILSNGNVGVGTYTAPHRLSVKGTISMISGSTPTQIVNISQDGSNNGYIAVNDSSGTTRARFDSVGVSYVRGGNFGINAVSPAYSLDLGETASTIRLVGEDGGTTIRIGAGGMSNDVTLIRVDGSAAQHDGESNTSAYGYALKYMGNQTDNRLSLWADSQLSTQTEAVSFNQEGDLHIYKKIGLGGATYGTAGQVLTSGGPSASPTWGAAPSGVPQGCILLWSGAANAIPSGYVICDGNNSTPDLRNKFVVGASSSGNTTYPGLSVDAEGGSADAVVVEHKHTTNIDGGHVIPGNGGSSFPYGGAGTYSSTVFSMSNEGVSGTNKNLPPYYALCYIMKT